MFALTCQVSQPIVPITIGYHGVTLTVSGENSTGDDLIIKVSSQSKNAHYKYIGKAGGLFWMKKGDISFKNVPSVYLLYSSGPLDQILNPEEQKAYIIGYDALKAATEMESGSEELNSDVSRWKEEFIRFKEKQDLYAIKAGTVVSQKNQTGENYQLEIDWPYQASPGEYSIEVLAINNGKVVAQSKTSITVEQVGVVKKLSDMAINNAAIYGLMAVLIAIIAGFAVGLVFKKGGGAH